MFFSRESSKIKFKDEYLKILMFINRMNDFIWKFTEIFYGVYNTPKIILPKHKLQSDFFPQCIFWRKEKLHIYILHDSSTYFWINLMYKFIWVNIKWFLKNWIHLKIASWM